MSRFLKYGVTVRVSVEDKKVIKIEAKKAKLTQLQWLGKLIKNMATS